MMVGYLLPQEWIRVVGRTKVDAATGDLHWKAHEIVKISTQRALQYVKQQGTVQQAKEQQAKEQQGKQSEKTQSGELLQGYTNGGECKPETLTASKTSERPTRVLICQKSSCRQRGSQVVADTMAKTIQGRLAQTTTAYEKSDSIQFISTGCMKQCKSGPHVVVIPQRQQQKDSSPTDQQLAKAKYNNVTPDAAQQIAHRLIESIPIYAD